MKKYTSQPWLYDSLPVSIFNGWHDKTAGKKCDLWTFLWDDHLMGVDRVARVREVRNATDKATYDELKSELPMATTAGTFEGRTNKIITSTGLLCLDMDAKDNPQLQQEDWRQLGEELMETGNVVYFGRSAGGKGYFALVAIDYPTDTPPADYKAQYERAHDFLKGVMKELYGVECDKQCSNVNRLRALSYDPAALVNRVPEVLVVPPPRPKAPPRTVYHTGTRHNGGDDYDRADKVVSEFERKFINVVDEYGDWYRVGMGLATTLGEAGRELFHRLSALSPKYKPAECDKKYNNLLQSSRGNITLGTLIHMAKFYGLA